MRVSYADLKSLAKSCSDAFKKYHPDWVPFVLDNGDEYQDGQAIYVSKYNDSYHVCLVVSGNTCHNVLAGGTARECYNYLNGFMDSVILNH